MSSIHFVVLYLLPYDPLEKWEGHKPKSESNVSDTIGVNSLSCGSTSPSVWQRSTSACSQVSLRRGVTT
jgi:hypothetical protein